MLLSGYPLSFSTDNSYTRDDLRIQGQTSKIGCQTIHKRALDKFC